MNLKRVYFRRGGKEEAFFLYLLFGGDKFLSYSSAGHLRTRKRIADVLNVI